MPLYLTDEQAMLRDTAKDFVAAVADITGGKGVDVILDMVAGSYVAREVECMAEDDFGQRVEAGFDVKIVETWNLANVACPFCTQGHFRQDRDRYSIS